MKLLGQVTAQGQDGCAELGQLRVLDGWLQIRRLGQQRRLCCCRPRRGLLLSLSVESNKSVTFTISKPSSLSSAGSAGRRRSYFSRTGFLSSALFTHRLLALSSRREALASRSS